jgi:hypothetical protein
MSVVNNNFNFTVKVAGEHYGGEFNYAKNGVEMVKLTFRRLPVKSKNGYSFDQTRYLRNVRGQWMFWDFKRRAPRALDKQDHAAYAVFREAYGLSLLNEA